MPGVQTIANLNSVNFLNTLPYIILISTVGGEKKMLIIVLGLALVIGFAVGFAQEIVNYLHKNGKVIRTWAAVVSICMMITGFILCLCSQWLIGFAFFISAIILTYVLVMSQLLNSCVEILITEFTYLNNKFIT